MSELQKRDGSWVSVIPKSGVSALKNCTNPSMEYESKNSAQLGREISRNIFFNVYTESVL